VHHKGNPAIGFAAHMKEAHYIGHKSIEASFHHALVGGHLAVNRVDVRTKHFKMAQHFFFQRLQVAASRKLDSTKACVVNSCFNVNPQGVTRSLGRHRRPDPSRGARVMHGGFRDNGKSPR
jgi:hypothetical protein